MDVGDVIGWVGVITIFVLFWVVIYYFWRRARGGRSSMGDGDGTVLSSILRQIIKLDEQISQLLEEVDKLRKARDELKAQAQEHAKLRRELEEKNVIETEVIKRKLCVLGVWTEAAGLDPNANAKALAAAGVDYTELIGERASMEWIAYELPRKEYTTIEFGVKGNAEGLQLFDGVATTSWLADLATEYRLETFLLFSDNSGGQGGISLADAVLRSPTVTTVISVDKPIPDSIARRFARMLYARLGEGATMGAAVRQARIAVGAEFSKVFTLREKAPSGD